MFHVEPSDGCSPTEQVVLLNVLDAVAEWHNRAGDGRRLHEFLGMPEEAYARWVEGRMTPEELAGYGLFDE